MKLAEAEKYLYRIGIDHLPQPGYQTLQMLQKKHLLSVPFENLDIHLHTPIIPDTGKFYEKLVHRRRGGFCYELNGLFNELLKTLGFDTRMVSARAFQPPDKYGAEFDHLAIIVLLNEKEYIVDVGFGEFAFGPLLIHPGAAQTDERGIFVIEKFDAAYSVVRKQQNDGLWKNEYIFSDTARTLLDFSGMCHYHQQSPESHFTKKMLCSLPVENGRITLTNGVLKITHSNHVREIPIPDSIAFEKALKEYFGIDLQIPSF
jgi:N-hydroxyarylamine O-acetyltransferase